MRAGYQHVKLVAAILALFFVCAPLGAPAAAGETIHVAAAVSLREAFTDAAKRFEAESQDRVDFTFGSSGQLMSQIRSGAPVDVFISAAAAQVDDLDKAGLTDPSTRCVVARNELVLIVPPDAKGAPGGFDKIAEANLKRLAIGEPRTVPAGQYAQQVLNTLHQLDKLRERIVYGSNVRQVLDYVIRGEVSAGIVYQTDAIEAGDKVKLVATADPRWHEPIFYPAVVIRASRNNAAARRFIDFLVSDKAQRILQSHGFTSRPR